MNIDGENNILYFCEECVQKVYSTEEIEELKLSKLIPYFHDN